jgi:hypothetical protein
MTATFDKIPFRPLNPWGRAMPQVKKRDLQSLYQVFVETDAGAHIAISPKFGSDDGRNAAEQICEAANVSILKRIHPEWLKAYVKRYALVPKKAN